jgi:hypothetical protein
MTAIPVTLLILLWAGVFILTAPGRIGLKERALIYIGRGRELASESRLNKAIKKLAADRKKERILKELSESLAYIKNLVVLGRGRSLSTELLLTELAEFCKLLGPVYLDMAHSLHVNDKEKAEAALGNVMDGGFASDIGRFLAGWDELPPEEMEESVDLYGSTLREERESRLRARDELVSDLIYFPAIANSMLVMLNFVYVAFFMQQREALAMFM